MAANNTIGLNIELPIYNSDGSSFHGLVLHKSTYDSVVMSLGDKITGDVYYPTNDLVVTTQEYVEHNGVKFQLVNHPTIVREGMATDNSQLKGMTKYSFVFYHPMYMLGNLPFTDVAVTSDETKYLSESKHFSWIGYPDDFFAKINKNLASTQWIVEKSSRFPQELENKLSEVLVFDENTIADAVKKVYDEWGVPYVVSQVASSETSYAQGKRFKVVFGLPSNEIYEDATHESHGTPFVFKFGQGVGLKNNSRTPRNNKIITRIAGYGSENNVPYGYPQIPWYGDSRWDYTEYEGSTINYDADGHVTNTPKTTAYPLYMGIVGGAYVKLIKHPFTRTTLMPSVFSQTIFNKVSPYMPDGTANASYDPNTTIVDYYDAITSEEYPYPNPIVPNAPSYESHQFGDIKPELGDEEIDDAWPINDSDKQRADAWDDSLDEDGNYKQGYFKVKLPILSFDIYACAAITQEMQINMRSGACLGCTFTVQVDWDVYKNNFYDADGNFAPNGTQRDYNVFPNSKYVEVELILQKDTTTFGTLMPNVYQQPEQGDLFVVLGISLPLSYITNAEERLDKEMKSYMLENNVHYFDYPLKFDEDFLRKNTNILSQIRPNSIIRFEYADSQLSLYVKQLTIKYGESALPKYDITLTDNVDVILNQIGQVADDVERISSIISILRQNYGKNVWYELSKKLSRVDDDVAYGNMRFRKNVDVDGNLNVGENATFDGSVKANTIQSSEFTGDGMLDAGYKLWFENGRAKLVIDDLVARGKFTVNELESRIWTYAGGNMVFSGAGSTIFYVEYLDANGNTLGYTNIMSPWLLRGKALLAGQVAWSKRKQIMRKLTDAEKLQVAKFRCYEYSDNGTIQTRNWWHVNDLAFCESLNHVKDKANSDGSYSGSAENTVYWRKVVGIGSKTIPAMNDGRVYDYVDLSLSDHATGYDDWPAAGDVIVQRGNVSDVSRQSMVSIEITGDVFHGFKIYDGISSYTASNTEWISLGYDVQTGKADAKIFGDCYIGARDQSYYIRLTRGNGNAATLDIKAKINISSTFGNNRTVEQALEDIDDKGTTYTSWNEWVVDGVSRLRIKDLYVPDTDYPAPPATAIYKVNHIYRCTAITPDITWEEVVYTDDTALHNYAAAILGKQIYSNGDVEKAAAAEKAIRNALGGNTFIDGGLMLTEMIAMRKYNGGDPSDIENYTTWGGLSGEYVDRTEPDPLDPTVPYAKGHGMAFWCGGDMIDFEMLEDYQQEDGWGGETYNIRWAKSLDRFDGSGYRAGGNLSWDEDGDITLKGKNISAAHYYLSDGTEITSMLRDILSMFRKVNVAQSGQTPVYAIEAQMDFYSVGGISALGYNSSGGGGASGALYNLIDVKPDDVTNPSKVYGAQTGYVLTYGSDGKWYANEPSQGVTTLADLNDTAITSVANGQVLKYNSTSGKWENGTISGGVQSDWNEADQDSLAYIQNKPTIPTASNTNIGYAANADYAVSAGGVAWGDVSSKPNFATVATSGNYNDLNNKPSIPSVSGSVSGSTLTITINGSNYSLTDTNTWRPLGTGSTDAAAGNHNHDERYLKSDLVSIELNTDGSLSGYGGYIDFHFNGSQSDYTSRIIEDQSGRLNITGDLAVGGGDLTINEPVSGGAAAIWFQSGGTTKGNLRVKANGELYFYTGTGAETTPGCINAGELYSYGAVTCLSDKRKKDVQGNIGLSVRQIADAPAIKFLWKQDHSKGMQAGSIAQYWQKVLPEVVIDKNDELSLQYGVTALVSTICVAKKVVSHDEQIKQLKKRISELENEIEYLKSA